MNVDPFVLEHATPRAGSLEALRGLTATALIGLGVVNPRTPHPKPTPLPLMESSGR
jgi:hypothetical protein